MASFQNPCDVEEARILENAGNDDDGRPSREISDMSHSFKLFYENIS
jgi:PhoPQ-activated pathogenicity-related protein